MDEEDGELIKMIFNGFKYRNKSRPSIGLGCCKVRPDGPIIGLVDMLVGPRRPKTEISEFFIGHTAAIRGENDS